MPLVNDLWKIRFRQTLQGHNLDNNLAYITRTAGSDTDPAAALAAAWYALFSVAMTALQSTAVDYQYVDAVNLNDATEYYRLDVTGETLNGGGLGTDPLAYWNAIGYSKRPRSRLFGVGKFRVRGITEFFAQGLNIDSALNDAMEDMRDTLGMNVETLGGAVYEPVVLRQERVPENPALPFEEFTYTYTTLAGVTLLGMTHKVKN